MGSKKPEFGIRRAPPVPPPSADAFVGLGTAPGDAEIPGKAAKQPTVSPVNHQGTETAGATQAPPQAEKALPTPLDGTEANSFTSKPSSNFNTKETNLLAAKTENNQDATPSKSIDSKDASKPSPRGRRLETRADGSVKRKQTFYLDAGVSRRLAIYCAGEGRDISGVVTEAISLFLDNQKQ